MLFNSWEFAILLLATAGLYYLPVGGRTRRVWQVLLLLCASAVFYAWENPRLLLLLACSCLTNAVAVERILFHKVRDDGRRSARRWLHGAVAVNLGLLAFFKYAGFLAGLLPEGWLGTEVLEWVRGIPLPVGISFYTFQGISLVVDT